MSFLHPGLLAAGLAAVALPILIHVLFRRRRRPVTWGAMRFVLEAYRRQRRRIRLEQILLLGARCLLVALIGVALARPILGGGASIGSGPVDLYILIDDSLTASLTDADGVSALDRHKRGARGLLDRLSAARGDRAGLLTLATPSRSIVLPPSADLDSVAGALDRLSPAASRADPEGALARLRGELEGGEADGSREVRVVLLSDFYAGSVDLERALPSLGEGARLSLWAAPPRAEPASNTTIVSFRLLRSVLVGEAQVPAKLTLRRSGASVGEGGVSRARVRLVTDDGERVVGDTTVEWESGRRTARVPLTIRVDATQDIGGGAFLRAEIDADPIPADNAWRMPVSLRRAVRVGIVSPRRLVRRRAADPLRPADWFALALSPFEEESAGAGGREIEVTRVDPSTLDGPMLASLDGVVIVRPELIEREGWERLGRYARAGGLVVVTPPAAGGGGAWTDDFLNAFELAWTIAPDPLELGEGGAGLSGERPRVEASVDLLSMIEAELADLAGPVRVHRVLESALAGDASGAPLLTLADGRPLLLAGRPGSEGVGPARPEAGLVVFLATALDFAWTDLPARPLVVPLLQEIVRQGVGLAGGEGTHVSGQAASPRPGTSELRAIGEATPSVVPIDASGGAGVQIRGVGVWRAVDDRGAVIGHVAVNADARAGSVDRVTPGELERWLAGVTPSRPIERLEGWTGGSQGSGGGEAGSSPSLAGSGSELSMQLLLAACVLAVVELVLARVFTRVGSGRGGGA